MQNIASRFLQLVELSRVRNRERVVPSSVLVLLIAALLWQTTWPALRPGLTVLLLFQFVALAFLLYQNGRIARAIQAWTATPPTGGEGSEWFKKQELSAQRLAAAENLGRLAGFGLLAYGFWASSGLLWLAIGLGLIYPIVIYFGITRINGKRKVREAEKWQRAIQDLHCGSLHSHHRPN